jgi:hypothetical protein
MSESQNPGTDESPESEAVEQVRTDEPQAPFGQDEPNPDVVSDATADETEPAEQLDPGVGGYEGRDPKSEMPRVPSAPQTQDDPSAHDAAPNTDREPPASN